ncbi:hypothetical protein DF111_12815 [Burkholderia stagnalis]|nr:hypothetical protein DF119_29280 [Burkholderia stagnalis]RQY33379.1 hypothetical protein DF116_25095 [Burkholderia stagnalis]RQY56673.1 hypothetical protein DF111_12815 [Burkholderia stagnalis]
MPNEISHDAARAAVQAALTDAIARKFSNALPIHGHGDTLPGWTAKPGHCHAQVECWLQAHPGDTAVRGWITDICFDDSIRWAAHSLVRTAAGALLDVPFSTPSYVHHFIGHPAAAGDFFALVLGEPPLPYVVVPLPDRS